jgi:hypothetical protein
MKIEQRIGRIDRRGQTSPLIRIISFLTDDTVEETIYSRCFERIQLFNQHIGGLEHVIGDIDKKVTKILFSENYSSVRRNEALNLIFKEIADEKSKLEILEKNHTLNNQYDERINESYREFNEYYTLVVSNNLSKILQREIIFDNDYKVRLNTDDFDKILIYLNEQMENIQDLDLYNKLLAASHVMHSMIACDAPYLELHPDFECSLFQSFVHLNKIYNHKMDIILTADACEEISISRGDYI